MVGGPARDKAHLSVGEVPVTAGGGRRAARSARTQLRLERSLIELPANCITHPSMDRSN